LVPFADDPISYTIIFPNSNSNGNRSIDCGLLTFICSSDGLNISEEGYVSTPIYNPINLLMFVVIVVANVVIKFENIVDL
jgi:hypothetical protein